MATTAALDLLVQLKGEAEKGLAGLAETVGDLGSLTAGLATGGVVALGAAFVTAGASAFSFASDAKQGVNDFKASLGLAQAEAEQLGDVATDIFGDNWGESLDDVNQAVIDVQKQFKGLGGIGAAETKKLVTGAFALRDSFGVDTAESISAARTLMEQFGISGQEALDFITKGFQDGLNSSGDFLESIGEYSTQLANGGATAEQFFSLMETGLGSGVLGTDKAADSFKEFTLRIADGSTTTADALKGIGLSAAEVDRQLASGQMTKADVFQLVIDKLQEMDNSVKRDQIGVALLGTQYEDLGMGAALNIDLANTKMSDLAGATDTLNAKYDNLGSLFSGTWRMIQADVLGPLGETLLGLANEQMPTLQGAVASFAENVVPQLQAGITAISQIIGGFQTGDFTGALESLKTVLPEGWAGPIVTGLEGARQAFGFVRDETTLLIGKLGEVKTWLETNVPAAIAAVKGSIENDLIPAFNTVKSVAGELGGNQLPALTTELGEVQSIGTTAAVRGLVDFAVKGREIQGQVSDDLVPALNGLFSAFGLVRTEGVSPLTVAFAGLKVANNDLLSAFRDGLQPAAITIATLFNMELKRGLDSVRSAVIIATEAVRQFTASFAELRAGIATIPIIIDTLIGQITGKGINIGNNLVEGIKQGILGGIPGLQGVAANAVAAAVSAARNAGVIRSPSRKMAEEVGLPLAQGVAAGLKDGQRDAVEAAADLINKIGDALSSISSGFGAANDVQVPAREKLQAIAIALRDAVADFWHEAQGVLYALKDDRVAKFADAATKTVGLIGAALSSFEKIKDFAGVPADAFETVGVAIADALVEVAFLAREFADQGLDKAAEFAQAAGQIVGLFKTGAESLGDLKPIADIPGEVFESIGTAIADALIEIAQLAREFADQGIPAAAEFAESAGKVIQVVGAAVTAFGGLNEYRDVAPERMRALAADMEQASALMLDIASRANTEGLENAAAFATAMQAVFALFKTGVEALDAIREYQAVPVDRMTAVLADFDMALRIMLQVVAGADQEGVPIAAKFAQAASHIFDAMKTAIEALDAIREYQAVPAERFAAFEIDFSVALALMDRIWRASEMLLYKAQDWQLRMEQVRDSINAGIDALRSIRDADEALGGDYIPGEPALPEQRDQGFTLGGMRALGGSVREGLAYVVGERGRELFVPSMSGAIVPNSQLAAAPVYITIDARGSADARAVEDAGYRGAKRALKEAGYRAEDLIRMKR